MDNEKYLGPYRLGELLGKGGMGAVYEAAHAKSGDRVAVKLISLHLSDEMRFRQRFEAEVETLKLLRHKNIVQLIGYGEEAGQLFYSMELVDGETLQTRIRREKKIEWMAVIEYGIQICGALKHAHDIGVFHRDIKPANLILTPDGTIKLVDFGIAKTFGFGEHTAVGSVLGTADYMAPEQAQNHGITQRTDLYSLGSVMYAMLVGRPPFRGKTITQVIDSLKRDKPVPLEMIDPNLPDDLVELIHQLLAKNSEDRPPTALAVMNRLKAMHAGLKKQATMAGVENDTTQSKRSIPIHVNPSANTVHVPGAAPGDHTIVDPASRATQAPVDPQTEQTNIERKTHFQTVENQNSTRGRFATEQAEASGLDMRMVTIGILALCLIGGVFFIGRGIINKQESVDEIYERITQANSEGRLKESRGDLRRFVKLFPDDHRYDEVSVMLHRLELDSQVLRLKTQKKIGASELQEHEQAFLDAMELRDSSPEAASKKLGSWSAAFLDSVSEQDESVVALAELAKFEARLLKQRGPRVSIDPRIQGVLDRIESASSLPQNEQLEMLEGIVEFYGDQKWAQSAVEAAKRRLDSMQ